MDSFAVYYEPDEYSLKSKIMGRQSAGSSFLQAIANHRPSQIWCYSRSHGRAQHCAQTLAEFGAGRTGVAWLPLHQPERLAQPGLLYRPDPVLGQHAWHRLSRAAPRSYSICGITHTISSHGPMSAFADYLTAPIESWDALICTSRAARDAVRHVLEQQAEHLRARLGASHFTLPQLPVIPLGIHTHQFAPSSEMRAAARTRLGLAEDEVAVLFAGRLIMHGKAHPLPMYLALEEAAQGRKVVLIQAGQAPNAAILKLFSEGPERLCPSVRSVMVDGADFDLYRAAWAAADIFTSPSDNIQETFGLTPVEAMAAGLPVVVSDWDGYKDTIRDGVDGFRVPTLTLPPGSGGDLADRFDLGLIDFDHYSGYASQLVAIDVSGLAMAYRRLIDDPELRRRMGTAGAQRAREHFDWSVVFRRYLALWEDLAERRRADPQMQSPLPRRRRPDRADPFSMFASYPTFHAAPGIVFRLRKGIDAAEVEARRALPSVSFAQPILPSPELVEALLAATAADWTSFESIQASVPGVGRSALAAALTWLAKIGALQFERAV